MLIGIIKITMKKEELIELIKNLHPEDTKGEMTGVFIGRHGETVTTDNGSPNTNRLCIIAWSNSQARCRQVLSVTDSSHADIACVL